MKVIIMDIPQESVAKMDLEKKIFCLSSFSMKKRLKFFTKFYPYNSKKGKGINLLYFVKE